MAASMRCDKLGHVELDVTDLERSHRFYRDVVGLEDTGLRGTASCTLRCGVEGDQLVLHAAAAPGHRRTGWRLEHDDDLDLLAARLRLAEIAFLQIEDGADRHGVARALRFAEPATGAMHEFYVARPGRPATGQHASHTAILRLGHVVFATPQASEAVDHYRRLLDFRESDRIAGGTTFLRPGASPFHHGLGIGHAAVPRLHHVNFMVDGVDDIGRALHRLHQHGVPIVFGPGRHPVSGSVFLYFLDPDGLTLEFSCGMERFAERDPRPPREWANVPASIDTWGAPRDPRMGAVGAIATEHPVHPGRGR